MPTITLQEAETIIEGAKTKIQELGVKMSVSVTDAGPRVVRGRDEPITVWTI
jgi:uncharacterized protein GlcG (DUF336 family)